MEQIQALKFDVQEVGKHVKGSKKRYAWQIALKQKQHIIVLDFSFISGKVKITVDRKILLENELPANVSFQYPFTLDGFALNIIQQGENFELRINNKVFSHLYTQQKTNTEFKKYQEEVKDIKVNLAQLNPPNKKISLNIGAFGPQKKKKEAAGQSGSWDAFSGGSFPNYFGQAPQVAENKPQEKPQPKLNLLGEQESTQPSVQSNLLQDVSSSKKQESFFDLGPQTSKINNSQDFGNMQQMMSGLNLKSQTNNQVDFFADQPKRETSPTQKPVVQNPPSNFNTFSFESNFTPSGNAFSTGFTFDQVQTNPKQFSTTVASKPAEINPFNQVPPKQEINLGTSVFTKKSSPEVSPTQLKNPNIQASISNPLTDINLNDFMSHKTAQNATAMNVENSLQLNLGVLQPQTSSVIQSSLQQTPNSGDFTTMQLLFQSNSFGQSNFGSTIQTTKANFVQQPQEKLSFNFLAPSSGTQNLTNTQFSTMRNLFQTASYNDMNVIRPQVAEPKVLPDFIKNNKPENFTTMGGVSSNGSFNMAAFGTMQVNNQSKTPVMDFNFLENRPKNPTSSGEGDLI